MDRKGVSVLVGFILLMLIGMIFLSVVQTKLIPSILKDVEIKHMNRVTGEVFEMDKAITSGKISTLRFDLGVSYPKYLFLLTPQTIPSSISAEGYKIVVSGIFDSKSFKIENVNRRIVLRLNYFVNPNYEIVYENSAVFKALGNIKVVSGEQKMFGKDFVNVYIVNTSFNSLSSNHPISLTIIPISVPNDVGGVFVGDATIEFETLYPDYWNETLKALSSSVDYITNYSINGNNVTVNVKNVTLRFYYVYVTSGVGTSVEQAYEYLKGISLSPSYMIKTTYVDVDPIPVNQGQSVVLGVRVLDRYFNPLENVKLSVLVDGANADTLYTNDKGEAYFVYTPESIGTHAVKIYCTENPAVYVTYNIEVKAVSGGNVSTPYTINWEKNEYILTFMPWESEKTLEMKAYTNPTVVGVNVQFATDQPESLAYFNPNQSKTNDTGWVTTNLTVNSSIFDGDYFKQITAFVLSWFAGDTAVVDLYRTLVWIVSDYTNFSQCILYNTQIVNETGGDAYVTLKPESTSNWLVGWNYRRPIYVQENSGNTLTDYQVKIVLNSSNFDFSKAKSDGSDVRFTDSDGLTLLDYWIESWDSVNQNAVIWVKIPQINANENKTIYIYYGNSSATYDPTHYGLTKVMTQLPANDGAGYTIYYEPWYMPSQLFTTTGTAMNWNADDGVWTLTLPFEFPFYSSNYTSVYVCSNGYVGQYRRADYTSTVSELENRNMISPFWADLRTDFGHNIYVNTSYSDSFGDGVYIRWYTSFYPNLGQQNFAVVLYRNGLIRFDYGTINGFSTTDDTPVIGISYGDGTHYTLITTTDNEPASNWDNHNSIMFWPRKKADVEPTVIVGNEETPNYVSNGYVKSYVKDLGQNSTIYFLQWNGSLPSGTEMSFYIRASNQSFDPNDTSPSWTFVGYASDGYTFDLRSKNIVGRYVQWMVYLNTTDNTKTPVLEEVVVGYIP